ncbi:MAG: sporulation protein YunB [Oscillospiraceae bacterium]|nr:sporulation protein YunB [Oscillospiraceae bacterium]
MLIKRKNLKVRKIGIRLIIIGIIVIIALIAIDIRVRPMIRAAGEFQCQMIAVRLINNAVSEELERAAYSSLITLTRDNNGNVVSIESDMASINRLKARIAELINAELSTIEDSTLKIPIGTISGFNLLYGRGVAIPVRLMPRGSATIDLISKFSESGINQTLHQIVLSVSTDIAAIVPGYTTSINIETQFIVAQTVIIGYVPESYTHIILGA